MLIHKRKNPYDRDTYRRYKEQVQRQCLPRAIHKQTEVVDVSDGIEEQSKTHNCGEAGAPVDQPGGGQPVVVQVRAHPLLRQERTATGVRDGLDPLLSGL